ncbi:SpoIIE family protein phosphatase [Candidatus Poribacteria bacterium]|nr:SpoIIE family protein phosphatase [Candidatus Poribacteria bacterium]
MLTHSERVNFLKKTELFSELSVPSLENIADLVKEVRFSPDEMLFEEGEKGDAVYFIVEGQLKVHKSEVEIAKRGGGEFIGEMAVMDEGPRSASVSSIGNSVLLKLEVGQGEFYQALQEDIELLKNVMKVVVQRFREDMERQIQIIRQNERMMQDMTRARELQMNMLPTEDLNIKTPDGLTISASGACYPAELVGGDYYDYFLQPDEKVGIVMGDVMGHGFHSGLMVSTAKSCLHTQLRTDSSIKASMSALNDMVYSFVHGNLFMSFCHLTLDVRDRTLNFCNAGHPYPYHYHCKSRELDTLESNYCLLGVLEDQEFNPEGKSWEVGDLLVLYTDGITEAENSENQEFGEERLQQIIVDYTSLSASQLKDKIFRELNTFRQGVVQRDDTSLVVIKIGD